MSDELKVAALFAGIGGIELGLAAHGHRTVLMCDIDDQARGVLGEHFPGIDLFADVRDLERLPDVDVLTAGFPCQDLSQAGHKRGITGQRSSLVNEVFRLLDRPDAPEWILLENVSYMLRLDNGLGMHTLVTQLEALGYRWAYRVVDARAFGIPQRRQRVVFLASRTHDPSTVLFADDVGPLPSDTDSLDNVDAAAAYGFYWTEGRRGLGWARDAVPTIKGGSGLGIPSPPAVWLPGEDFIGTPSIRDSERLQGFDADWTVSATKPNGALGNRWRLVGNAVCVSMSEWVGWRLTHPDDPVETGSVIEPGVRWPNAACGESGKRWSVPVSMFPQSAPYSLSGFLKEELVPLSLRATAGFRKRAEAGGLRFAPGFLEAVRSHEEQMSAV